MRRLLSVVKNELLTGLLLLAPILGAAYFVYWLVAAVDGWVPERYRPIVGGVPVPGIGLIVVLALAFIVGVFAHNYFGRRAVRLFDDLAHRVPLFGSTYGLIKQVLEAVFSSSGNSFNRAVLVPWPVEGSWVIAFVTQPSITGRLAESASPMGEELVSVYVPTTPNPTSGFYLIVERRIVRELDMSVEQAFKLMLTMGIADSESALSTTAKWSRPPLSGVPPMR